jgi:hypothetical protein
LRIPRRAGFGLQSDTTMPESFMQSRRGYPKGIVLDGVASE